MICNVIIHGHSLLLPVRDNFLLHDGVILSELSRFILFAFFYFFVEGSVSLLCQMCQIEKMLLNKSNKLIQISCLPETMQVCRVSYLRNNSMAPF